MFIVFEGPEGGGKTLQIKRLANKLESHGRELILTHEPGGTKIGFDIRAILLGIDGYEILPLTEVLLLAAGRAQHVHEVIKPALNRGAIVLCDRFIDSTYAYQGGGRGLDMTQLRKIQDFATGGLTPDVRILLDLPVDEGLKRRLGVSSGVQYSIQLGFLDEGTLPGRHNPKPSAINRIDMVTQDFHERVRQTYLNLVKETPGDWIVIDALQSPDAVEKNIWRQVRDKLAIA